MYGNCRCSPARKDPKRGFVRLFLTQSHEFIADSGDSKTKLRPSGTALQLLAQAGHMRVDCTSERTGLIAPERPQEFGSRDSTSSAFHQVAKKLELASCKINLHSVSSNFCAPDVYVDCTESVNTSSGMDWDAS